jgi:cytoskeleton protein RodZ
MARKSQTKDTSATAMVSDEVPSISNAESLSVNNLVVNSNCGGVLRQAREKQGLSVHDVSTSLRLSDKQIEAIESDQFHLLPQPSIVRGFIRNYAKIVKVDSDPIVAAYNALIPDAAPQSFTVKSNTTTRSVIGENKVSFSPALFIGLVFLFGLIAALFYYYTEHIKPNSAKPSAELTVNKEELNVDVTPNSASVEFALPAAERLPETTAPAEPATSTNSAEITLPANNLTAPTTQNIEVAPVAPAKSTDLPVATPQLQTELSINQTPAPAAQEIVPKPDNVNANEASNVKTLSFTASEETWINVVNSRGKQIYSKVLSAGQSESIQASGPLKLTVGNANSTTLNLDGQSVDLASHARNKVARLTID